MQTSLSINHELKIASLWIVFLAQLFYHLSQLPHRPLFPTQGTFISLTRKESDRLYNKVALVIKNIFLALGTISKTTLMKRISLSHMVLERSTTF